MSMDFKGYLKVEVNYSGLFVPKPLIYTGGLQVIVSDVDFAGFELTEFREFLLRLCKDCTSNVYYCVPGEGLVKGLRVIKNDLDYAEFINQGYSNGGKIKLYLDPYHEPLFEWISEETVEEEIEMSEHSYEVYEDDDAVRFNDGMQVDEEYKGDDEVKPKEVQTDNQPDVVVDDLPFEHEPEDEKVAPCDNTIRDPFLNKLCSRSVVVDCEKEAEVDEDDTHSLDDDYYDSDSEFKVKRDVVYPRHDPNQQWDLMKPVLGMRFESPAELKFLLANYGVANGYRLGYQKNDWRQLLCNCGEDARTRRVGRGKEAKAEIAKLQKFCPFRLWASWMGKEHSFQIKSLNHNHTCSRKFGLGSLVTYLWLAKHYALEIIENLHLTIRGLQADVLNKYHLKVSRNQCRRAKIKALYDLEGGLVEHYARLRDYANEILTTNLGSTVKLAVNDMPDGKCYFKSFYVCFKGVREGWKAGCRRVVGLDGCFLRGPVQGELLSAIGRDANNQMYPIAWAVVCVENKENWKWFVELLMDDLDTEDGRHITLISDQHKGLVEACREVAPLAEHRQCARHIYANFKKKFTGVHFRRLFWQAAMCSVETEFNRTMNQIKALDQAAYTHLMERDPHSWSRAFQNICRCCASVENGICSLVDIGMNRQEQLV